ncbi:hypothetical protein JYU34_019505 [Plutella xylostella]|uniref:HAUS augmin-like complex subunit 6 N-terminal domain-containing protein n=1 Tax=Plutella xylostella TaxID=51655 RepID=A0ABQ7PYD2_PLUXY|nr:hypothetical protein JYU34_019505 [Plutella xylostella]
MSSLHSQRDHLNAYKKATLWYVSLLSKAHSMPPDLYRQIFKEDALEKPTQNVFIHLTHYLACIIDAQRAAALTWPLYDSKLEKTYRTDFSNFIIEYCKMGVISPVMSSYFVNPGCFKVTKLLYQLSQFSVQRTLTATMKTEKHKQLYNEATERYKSGGKDFVEYIDKETETLTNKLVVYQQKKLAVQRISELMKKQILKNEKKYESIKAKDPLNNIVDGFLASHHYNDIDENKAASEIIQITQITELAPLFNTWLEHVDEKIVNMESDWDKKVHPFLETAKSCHECTEALILRQTGEIDKKSFMLEYNHQTDEINTADLQPLVNSQQKYVLKNIVKEERLNFPNLIRGFVIATCYILKNAELGEDIYKLSEYLQTERRNYAEIVSAFKLLYERVLTAEAKLQQSPINHMDQSISLKELCEIPRLPDLSDLKSTGDLSLYPMFDTFTPINLSKFHFNTRRKTSMHTFLKPQPRSLITPYQQPQRHDFLSSLVSCRFGSDNRNKLDMSQNISIISQNAGRGNETIAECTSGFTKQQIQRLLSTKKTSSSKKHKFNGERPQTVKVVKGGLFNDTGDSGLFRSHSSPNLFENRERKSFSKGRARKLSVMKEDSPTSLLEVSGISPYHISKEDDFNHQLSEEEKVETKPMKDISIHISTEHLCAKTPTAITKPIRKTSSIEKIINRFKKVRESVIPDNHDDSRKDFNTILEGKENDFNQLNTIFTANRVLLPDLLSPSYSVAQEKPTDILDQLCFEMEEKEGRKPRQSLGTALGVDNTFLDQFELID